VGDEAGILLLLIMFLDEEDLGPPERFAVEETDHPLPDPVGLRLLGIEGAGDGAEAGPGDQVKLDPFGFQHLEDPEMGDPPRPPSSQGQSDFKKFRHGRFISSYLMWGPVRCSADACASPMPPHPYSCSHRQSR